MTFALWNHRAAGCAAAALAAFTLVTSGAPASGVPTPAPPRLILAISVDQMRFDYLTRFDPLLKGGLRTLLDRGAVFTNARYQHANTETGPGHSVILSGRLPRHSGIVANDWFDSYLGRGVNVVDDPMQLPVGGQGRGASPSHFIGFTLGDALKRASPASKVVGISMKDRSAILMAGPRADAAYWYESAEGRFITSTYYMSAPPTWLTALNAKRLPDAYAGRSWNRLLNDPAVYRKFAGEDDISGEWDRKDTVFPHALRSAPPAWEFYDELRRTPFIDEVTLEFALRALSAHALGQDGVTDLLAVGFSATDVIGHTYGPDSHEAMDQILRLDGLLGRLFDQIERHVGPGRTLVVLTADHGVQPLVEVLQARGVEARRVRPAVLDEAVEAALKARYPGVSGIIALRDTPNYYLALDVLQRNGLHRADAESTIEKALLATGVVEAVYTHAQLMGELPKDDPFFALHQAAFFPPRSPHLIARVRPNVYISERPGGTGHGTPQDHDRHVPVVFMGTPFKPGRYAEACGPEDIAPTLAKVLGFDYPRQDSLRLLIEMLK